MSFEVTIAADKKVFDLKEVIKTERELSVLRGIDPTVLVLWKLNKSVLAKPTKTLASRLNLSRDSISHIAVELEEPLDRIFEIFPQQPSEDDLHIIVGKPFVENERGVKRPLNELGDLETERKNLSKIAKRAPSSFATPSTFQTSALPLVACNRPFDPHTIPIILLQEEFGLFMDDCKVLPSPKSQELLQALTVSACKWYENETQRRSEIQKVLYDIADLYLSAETIAGTEYRTDGNLRVNIMPPVIRKCKNEAGCALPEAIAYYVQFLVKALDRCSMRNRFPCILLVDTGPYLGLYGCLWTGEHLHVEPLTPLYDLTIHWADEGGRQAIAASLDAFLKAIPRLEAHYAQVAYIPLPHHSLQDRTYPYKTSYEDENGERINFSYRSRIAEKLVFVAKPDKSGDKDLGTLCVKFTRRYSEDAHRFLAKLGYAPRLRAAMRLPGGWIMVVMDYSEYMQLCDLQISDELRHAIMLIVQQLHEAGFVHGDIRSTNILVDRRTLTSKDGTKIHFIDFDWAGRQGEIVYPMRVNKVTVRRPEGVSDGELILAEHDIAMMNSLL